MTLWHYTVSDHRVIPGHRDKAERIARWAAELLGIPTPTIVWVEERRGRAGVGAFVRSSAVRLDGMAFVAFPDEIYLTVPSWDGDVVLTVLHELRHAWQVRAGLVDEWTPAHREADAERWAHQYRAEARRHLYQENTHDPV